MSVPCVAASDGIRSYFIIQSVVWCMNAWFKFDYAVGRMNGHRNLVYLVEPHSVSCRSTLS